MGNFITGDFIKYKDYIDNKQDNIHLKLYKNALDLYINDLCNDENLTKNEILKKYNFIEIKKAEYYLPSQVLVTTKVFPFKRYIKDLSKYWNNYQYFYNNIFKDINEINEIGGEFKNDLIVTDIDYVRGVATLYNKTHDKSFNIDLDYLNSNNIELDNSFNLDNTFTNLYNNDY